MRFRVANRHGTGSLGHRVSGSFGSSFTSGSPDHHFDPVWDPSFSGFRKKCPKYKTYIWMLKWQKSLSGVCCWTEITGCESMQFFFFYLWLLKILWPENTSSHISRHLKIIIEQGHWIPINWVSGSLDSRVTGSQNVTQFHLWWLKLYLLNSVSRVPTLLLNIGPSGYHCYMIKCSGTDVFERQEIPTI